MILVVDDDAALRELLQELLEGEGYEVRLADDGASAYQHLKDPDCKGMLLDFHMPHINGAELLLLMAAEGVQTPVLLMTADPKFEEEEMKQFGNVKKLLRKPFYAEDVLSAIRQYCEKPRAKPAQA